MSDFVLNIVDVPTNSGGARKKKTTSKERYQHRIHKKRNKGGHVQHPHRAAARPRPAKRKRPAPSSTDGEAPARAGGTGGEGFGRQARPRAPRTKRARPLPAADDDPTAVEGALPVAPQSLATTTSYGDSGTRLQRVKHTDLFSWEDRERMDTVAANPAGDDEDEEAAAAGTSMVSGSFGGHGLAPRLVQHLCGKMGLEAPTSVQKASFAPIMARNDTMIQAQTGSGKTLAYAIPAVHDLLSCGSISRSDGARLMVLVPTRELATQTLAVLTKLVSPFPWLVTGIITGGRRRKSEKACLRKGVILLVGTPGRMLDHMQTTRSFLFHRLQWLVLDEADRLLDMGFEETLNDIISLINERQDRAGTRQDRHTIVVSATLTTGVSRLARLSLTKPVTVSVDATDADTQLLAAAGAPAPEPAAADRGERTTPAELAMSVPEGLRQFYVEVPAKQRLISLVGFLAWKTKTPCNVLVFMSSCASAQFHHALLTREQERLGLVGDGHSEASWPKLLMLHGQMPQRDRQASFAAFSKAENAIMICTDVAARGLDFPAVKWIVQYDPPCDIEDYVHRIGRTARIGARGSALLFLMPSETAYLATLEGIGLALTPVPQAKIIHKMGGQKRCIAMQDLIENTVDIVDEADERRELKSKGKAAASGISDLAVAGFQGFVASYGTFPKDLKPIFHIKRLHLGHVAKSFGLRIVPSSIAAASGANRKNRGRYAKAAAARVRRSGGGGRNSGGRKADGSRWDPIRARKKRIEAMMAGTPAEQARAKRMMRMAGT